MKTAEEWKEIYLLEFLPKSIDGRYIDPLDILIKEMIKERNEELMKQALMNSGSIDIKELPLSVNMTGTVSPPSPEILQRAGHAKSVAELALRNTPFKVQMPEITGTINSVDDGDSIK